MHRVGQRLDCESKGAQCGLRSLLQAPERYRLDSPIHIGLRDVICQSVVGLMRADEFSSKDENTSCILTLRAILSKSPAIIFTFR